MCGIAGVLFPPETFGPDALTELAVRMADTLVHRGPASRGAWTDPAARIAFGHTRLEVVGLGEADHQPMQSADGRWVLSYNGEL